MPVKPETKKKFLKRVDRFLDLNERTTNKEVRNMVSILRDARNRVVQDMQTLAPTEWQAWYMPTLKARLDSRIDAMTGDMRDNLSRAQERMWELSIDKADELAQAAGIDVAPTMLDPELLRSTQTLTGELIVTLPERVKTQVTNRVALGMLQEKSINEVVADLRSEFGRSFFQMERIAATEMLRTQSLAQHKRFEQIEELQPGLMKGWRWSHKPDGRTGHAEAERNYLTNLIPFKDPFLVAPTAGGAKEPLQFPRDPAGSPANVIYCGCVHFLRQPE
jgi:hypothetical protein